MLTDKEREDLAERLQEMPLEKLEKIRDQLIRSKNAMQDLNSDFPATREFLKARGLTNVGQLDAAGRADLQRHLLDVLEKIAKARA